MVSNTPASPNQDLGAQWWSALADQPRSESARRDTGSDGSTPAAADQATLWARRGLKLGLLVLAVAVAAAFAHPASPVCVDQTAAQRTWMHLLAAWISIGGALIAAAAGMVSRARRGERGLERPICAALAVVALAAVLWVDPAPLKLLAIGVVLGAPIVAVLAFVWVLAALADLLVWSPPSVKQLNHLTRMLWFEVLLWLPALFVFAALLDNVYHDCS